VRKANHFQPAVNQSTRARCYDTPSCTGGLEGCEEVTAAGDLDGIGAEFFGDAAFDLIDICCKDKLSVMLSEAMLEDKGRFCAFE
jgi:hypothetical protein